MCYSKVMEKSEETPDNKTQTKSVSFKTRAQRVKAKVLGAYYGHPIKDMKLICITGSTGKAVVAHYVHEILNVAGHHVAVLASDKPFSIGALHKFLSDAWKAGATYVVVTAPADSLKNNVFFDLPVYVAALTDFVSPSLDSPSAEEFVRDETTVFDLNPEIVVVNQDDINYDKFAASFNGKKETMTYGTKKMATLRIEKSTLYKKGAEAELSLGSNRFTVATFVPGETSVSYMACAAAVATALKISPEAIADGIGNYNPEG